MKRIKFVLMAMAVITSVVFALATRPEQSCASKPQYFKVGSNYFPAGTYGVNYVCDDESGVCTYYRPNPLFQPNLYLPCRSGSYTPIW